MRTDRTRILVPALALWLAAVTPAQDRQDPPAERPAPAPERAATRDAQEEVVADAFAVLETGPKVQVLDVQGQPLGFVRDHVVDPRTGQVQNVVLTLAMPADTPISVLVPYSRIRWDEEKGTRTLPMKTEELRALPTLKAFQEEVAKGDAAAAGDARVIEASAKGKLPMRALASTLQGPRILADGAGIGRADQLVLDVHTGQVAFVLCDDGREDAGPLVIPFGALRWTAPGEEQARYDLALKGEGLEKAPRLKDGDVSKLAKPETRARVLTHYGLPVPVKAGGEADVDGAPRRPTAKRTPRDSDGGGDGR